MNRIAGRSYSHRLRAAVLAALTTGSFALLGAPLARAVVLSVGPTNGTFGGYVCADVTGGSLTPGTPVQAYDCNGAPNQQFELNGFTIYALGGQRCLDAAFTVNGTTGGVQSNVCNGSMNQEWYYAPGGDLLVGGQIVSFGSDSELCLDATTTANGVQLVTTVGNFGAISQNWQIKSAVLSVGPTTGSFGGYVCADVTNGSLAPGTPVQAYDCNAEPNQQFEFNGNTIYALGGQRCLGVSSIVPGAPVQSQTCNGSAAQLWYNFAGAIYSLSGINGANTLCLDATTAGKRKRTQLVINPCGFTPPFPPNQNWQFK